MTIDTVKTGIMPDRYITKWNTKSPAELDDESDILHEKLNITPESSIRDQLLEVIALLDTYRSDRNPDNNNG